MKLGLFTPVFGKLGVTDMLAKVRSFEKITAVELGTGAWPAAITWMSTACLEQGPRSRVPADDRGCRPHHQCSLVPWRSASS